MEGGANRSRGQNQVDRIAGEDRATDNGAGFFPAKVWAMNPTSRLAMIARPHPQFSLIEQCAVLKVPRSALYYEPKPVSDGDLTLMRRIDEVYTKWPFMARGMVAELRGEGYRGL